MTQVAELVIPKFSLKQTNADSNGMFHITEMAGQENQYRDMFLAPHRKDFYFLALVKEGGSRHWIDMVPYSLKPATFYFTIPHQVHIKEKATASVGRILCFTDEFLAIDENQSLKKLPIIQNRHNGHELNLSSDDYTFIDDLLVKILGEYNTHRQDWRNEMLLAYLKVLLIYLSRLYTEQFVNEETSQDRLLLKKFRALIDEQFVELHDVAAYAGQLNISPGHLGEVIKQQSGKTAIEHIHERLLMEARRLLFHTELSIKEISWQLGFEDASYFTRFFKRLSTDTPQNYRLRSRKMYH